MSPSVLISGSELMDPGDARHGSNENAVRVKHRLGEVGGSGRLADGHVLPGGGGDEATIGLGDPEFRA